MNGFVIVSGLLPARVLDRNLKWRKKRGEEAFVFSKAEKDKILEKAKSESWKTIPEYIAVAKYDSEKDTTVITGTLRLAYPDNKE